MPKYRQISKEWDMKVGIDDEDTEFKEKIIEIANKGMKLIEENQKGE